MTRLPRGTLPPLILTLLVEGGPATLSALHRAVRLGGTRTSLQSVLNALRLLQREKHVAHVAGAGGWHNPRVYGVTDAGRAARFPAAPVKKARLTSREIDEQFVALLTGRPGLSAGEAAQALRRGAPSTALRLARLTRRGRLVSQLRVGQRVSELVYAPAVQG